MKKYVFMYVLLGIFFSATETSNFNVKGMMCGVGCVNTINKEIISHFTKRNRYKLSAYQIFICNKKFF